MKTIIHVIRNNSALILYRVFSLLPVNMHKIIIDSLFGDSLTGNPKYLAIELLRSFRKTHKLIIISKTGRPFMGYSSIPKKSISYIYHAATAAYWISNGRMPLALAKRKKTVLLQTWHGTPLKKLVFDVSESSINDHSQKYKSEFYQAVKKWDHLLAQNEFSANCFESAFHYPIKKAACKGEILITGYPRNEIFFRKDLQRMAQGSLQVLNLPKTRKVILYAPTFRDNARDKLVQLEDILAVAKKIRKTHTVLIRAHYITKSNQITEELPDNVMDASNYDDVQELLFRADILVTDYSSLMFDFAHTRRAMVFFVPDLEKYKKEIRGFYLDYQRTIPGPICKTADDLYSVISTTESWSPSYKEKYDAFFQRFCSNDNGNVSKTILRRLLKVSGEQI